MRSLSLLFGIAFFTAQPVMADTIAAKNKITDVTVFSDRAAITRSASVDIPAGAHKIEFTNVPYGLYPDTLRIEGSGSTPITFGAISHKIVNQSDLVAPREKEINGQIRTLEDQKTYISANKAALEKQKVFLDSLMGKAASKSREEIADFNLKTEQWKNAVSVIGTEFSETEKEIIKNNIEIRTIDEQISKLKRDLSSLKTGSKRSYTLTIPVEAKAASKATLKISYQRENASWRPVYDARLDTQNGDLQIIQYGEVSQRTGQDWSNINLTLSTARPQRGASLPPLSPKWVSIFDPRKRAEIGFRTKAEGMSHDYVAQNIASSSTSLDEEIDAILEPAQMRAAQIETGGLNAEYKIMGASDVPADGTQTKLLIGPFDAKGDMQIHVKPQLAQAAYLVSKATLNGDAPILPGQVSLFADGNYVGNNHFPLLRPGKSHNLYFGIDDQIDVKREVLEDKSGESGLLGRDNEKEQRFITTVQNLRKTSIELVVTESIPVSKDEKVKTEIMKDSTTQGYRKDIENKKGVLQWAQTLNATEKTDIALGWRVTWPKDTHLNGL